MVCFSPLVLQEDIECLVDLVWLDLEFPMGVSGWWWLAFAMLGCHLFVVGVARLWLMYCG